MFNFIFIFWCLIQFYLHNWFFFTINLYNFILFILNNFLKFLFLKHHRRIYRWTFSVGILQRIEKYLLEMPKSSTSLQTKTFRWYLARVEKYLLHTDNYRHLDRQILFVGISPRVEKYLLHMPRSPTEYFQWEVFFLLVFSVCKTIGIFFYRQNVD